MSTQSPIRSRTPESSDRPEDPAQPEPRRATAQRSTSETEVQVNLNLDGSGQSKVTTGLGFLDHMLASFALFSRIDLELSAEGDLPVDDHHTVEDVALTLGKAIDSALGERIGLRRFGQAFAPLDEALVRCSLDLSGRPFARVELGFKRELLGAVATENLTHFFNSLASTARLTLHMDLLEGLNDHHKSEAAFKACGLALRAAVELDPRALGSMPSSKGAL